MVVAQNAGESMMFCGNCKWKKLVKGRGGGEILLFMKNHDSESLKYNYDISSLMTKYFHSA